jgi:hypothetical protein
MLMGGSRGTIIISLSGINRKLRHIFTGPIIQKRHIRAVYGSPTEANMLVMCLYWRNLLGSQGAIMEMVLSGTRTCRLSATFQ